MTKHLVCIILCLLCLTLACCQSPADLPPNYAEEEEEPTRLVVATPSPGSELLSPLCPGEPSPLITDLDVRKPPVMEEPPARSPFRDPVFGRCLVRVTDRRTDIPAGLESRGLKNEYARVQSFNADGRYLLAYGTGGDWLLYSAATLQPLGELPIGVEPRWDAHDPDLLFYLDERRLLTHNVATGQGTQIHDFGSDFPDQDLAAVWTGFEGRPSADTTTWGFMAEDADWLPVAFVVYDRSTNQVTIRDMHGVPGIKDDIDHVTISPLGTYFLASFDHYCDRSEMGDDAHPCGLMVYDRDLRNGRGLLRLVGHYDVALDANGREVVIFQNIDTDEIALLDLESGAITPLFPIDFSHTPLGFHFSGLAYNTRGWALVSTYSGGYPEAYTWMDDQVFAVELRAGGRVVRLAHSHSLVNQDQEHDYWAEPQATVNRDFTRVLFTTNWARSGSEEVEMFLIELADDWTNRIP